MHGECENPRVIFKNRGRAVTLVDIQIDDQHPAYAPFIQQHARGHGHIIEHAETRTMAMGRMVGTARRVAGQTVGQGQPCRKDRAPRGKAGAARHRLAHRQADAPDFVAGQGAADHGVHISGTVGQAEPRLRHGLGHPEAVRRDEPLLDQDIAQPAEFRHGKPVTVRQTGHIGGVMDDGERRGHPANLPCPAALAKLQRAPKPEQDRMTQSATSDITRRAVWRLAWPIMLANVSVPLLGLADTAVIGNVGTTASLGAIALGAVLFNFLYWSFGFLRMGTTGLVAQAYGAEDGAALKATLARALVVAGVVGALILVAQGAIAALAFPLFAAEGDVEAMARQYFGIRVWGAPAVLGQYVVLGWFIGAQDSRPVLGLQLFQNLTNIVLNLVLVLVFDLGVAGVAFGTLIAEWLTFAVSTVILRRSLGRNEILRDTAPLSRAQVLEPRALIHTFAVNRDILIRTLLLIAGFSWFTAMGSRLGPTTLAGNHVLLQFLGFSAFFLDGWAIAAEGLVGRAMGRARQTDLNAAVRHSTELAVATGLGLTVLFLAAGPYAIRGLTDIDLVRNVAMTFLPYAALHPIIGVWCFQFDGIFIGATRSRAMRNAMIESFVLYLALWWALRPFDNHGLWISFLAFFGIRGVTLALRYPALKGSIDQHGSQSRA